MPAAFYATTAKGMTGLLAEEVRALGGADVVEDRAGVAFGGGLTAAYRVCLWSRVASRVLAPVARFAAHTPEELYEGAHAVRWGEHLDPRRTFAVDCTAASAPGGTVWHTHYAALKVKDAVVDRLRTAAGARPSVDTAAPDLRLNLHLEQDEALLAVDLSGDSLHRRGYRGEAGAAPLRENLAAAVLLLARWPAVCAAGGGLVDPMCGAATLPIEAALIAADVAPGLLRRRFGFMGWRGHDAGAWAPLVAEARARDRRRAAELPPMVGYDADPAVLRVAARNLARAGALHLVTLERRELAGCEPPAGAAPGVLVVNPPYGERLGEAHALMALYARLGDTLKQRFPGWTGFVLTGNPDLGKRIGLKVARRHVLFNGAIECRLLEIPVSEAPAGPRATTTPGGAEAFANRLRKDLKQLRAWAAREGVTCYRVYDADLPEYAVAVDLYERWVHVQEYERPATVDARRAEARLHEALAIIPAVLGVPPADVFFKVRRRQRGGAQYEKLGAREDFHEVREGGHRFLVNFTATLDTGLFLDHRLTRGLVGELAAGRRFLNLFGYTGAATVYAARGGAVATTTVDLSNTYLDWARRNLELNGVKGARHRLVRADARAFLEQERGRYGLIFLDPPTFSKSKAMTGTLDVQRDHVELLRAAAALLEADGVLLFSNNFRRFKLDAAALPDLDIEDVTRATIPRDFARSPRIHNAWRISRRR
ncbi:MAG TPA: bifunctional 23S rRNA (guanine(2069)-N(7))-methyltransferase RlmK/23S rRNA (guanine(2445)-N(2))-methyltransferase RlmL [Polyangia bacterium]